MFLSKKLFNSSFRDIKLSYIIIEVVLIFIGVTFANLAYEKTVEKKDNKFISESLVLYKSELSKIIQENERTLKHLENIQEEYNEFYKMLKDTTVSENEIIANQKGAVNIIYPLLVYTKQTGLKNIINKDINLIQDFEFITLLGDHMFLLEHMTNSFNYYNDEIFKLYELFIEHINVDFDKNEIRGFKNLENLRNDVKFNNQLSQVLFLRKHHINDLRLLNEVYFKNMIESIDDYLNR